MIYYTDLIRIITVTYSKTGVITETEGSDIPARVKDYNGLIINNKGEEVTGQATIRFDKSYSIKYGDKIKIIKKWDVAYPNADKKFIVQKLAGIGGFKQEEWRVFI